MTRRLYRGNPLTWFRNLVDRFRPTAVPDGWTPETLAAIRPRWDEPLTGELPTIDDTHNVLEAVADELGLWVPALAEPVRPVFFDQLRDLRPVDLNWRPSWAVA